MTTSTMTITTMEAAPFAFGLWWSVEMLKFEARENLVRKRWGNGRWVPPKQSVRK